MVFFDGKPAFETPWTKKVWVYDLRTNKHSTLKTAPMKREYLDEFVTLYNPVNRHVRKVTWSADNSEGRWRAYESVKLSARDKASLDIFWLKVDSLADSDNLPPPDVIAQEIVEDLEAASEQFRLIAGGGGDLGPEPSRMRVERRPARCAEPTPNQRKGRLSVHHRDEKLAENRVRLATPAVTGGSGAPTTGASHFAANALGGEYCGTALLIAGTLCR